MKARYVASFVLVAALVVVSTAAARTDSPTRASASKITVWLQVDAQTGWPDLVASTNDQFKNAHPGTTVDVQYQTWPDHLGKFDATLAGGNVPDVIEMGNTEMTKYMAAGAFANLSSDRSSFANSRNWLAGLAASAYDYGGRIATFSHGKWHGALDSRRAMAGLAAYKRFFNTASRASRTGTEDRPQPYDVYAQGQAASIVGPAWFSCCVGKKFKSVTGQFVMPGHKAGQSMPGFLGGSDLAVPAGANDKSLAKDWIRIFTSTAGEKTLQAKGNIPNATNLLGNSVNERAAKRSWFVPTA